MYCILEINWHRYYLQQAASEVHKKVAKKRVTVG